MAKFKGVVCVLLLGMFGLRLSAFSIASPDFTGIFQRDSIPKKMNKRYVAWIDVARTDNASGTSSWVGRYKGKLRGITDTSLIFETKKPLPEWKQVGAYYEAPYSDIQMVAFRHPYSPFLEIAIGSFGGLVLGGVAGVQIAKAHPEGQQQLKQDLYGILGAMLGFMAGGLLGLLSLRKEKFRLERNKTVFSRHRITYQQYVQ